MTPSPGDRVVVRFRKGPGSPADWRADDSATMSDVTGVLVSGPPAAEFVVRRDGEELRVPSELVVAVKVLSDKPVRNSEIRSLEVASARGWPGVESEMIHGWLARAGGGFTRRANSAVPLEMGSRLDSETLAHLRKWYAARNLPVKVAVVGRLIPGSHVSPDDYTTWAEVLTAPVGLLANDVIADVVIDDRPSDDWVAAYAGERGDSELPTVRAVISAVDDGHLGFATVLDEAGGVIAIGRGAVTTGLGDAVWLGLSALWTSPEHRGRGLGRAIVAALQTWGAGRGATATYLQVEAENTHAREWYRRLGFGLHHSYGYVTYP